MLIDVFQVTHCDANRLVKNLCLPLHQQQLLYKLVFHQNGLIHYKKEKGLLMILQQMSTPSKISAKIFECHSVISSYLIVKATEIMSVTHTVNDMAATTIEDLVTALECLEQQFRSEYLKLPAEESVLIGGPL
jgi:hypothetical protein